MTIMNRMASRSEMSAPKQRITAQGETVPMSDSDLVGFEGSFTEGEITRIRSSIERAEGHFENHTSNSLMPPWFVVKDNLPGQSEVFVAHRFGKEHAIVAHSIEELVERLDTERPD